MNTFDTSIVFLGFGSFVLFLFLHIISFRLFKREDVFKAIMMTALGGLLICAALSVWVCFKMNAYFWKTLILILCASTIYGLSVFAYILCVFGPSETSIRMRLVHELYASQRLSRAELSQKYNASHILEVRLKRLIASGDVIQTNGEFHLGKSRNMFFILDKGAAFLNKWINGK